jgi:hypothetical protein
MLKTMSLKQGVVIAFYQLWFAAAFLLSCIPLVGPIIGDLLLALFVYTSSPPPFHSPVHYLILLKHCYSEPCLNSLVQQTHKPPVRPLPL